MKIWGMTQDYTVDQRCNSEEDNFALPDNIQIHLEGFAVRSFDAESFHIFFSKDSLKMDSNRNWIKIVTFVQYS